MRWPAVFLLVGACGASQTPDAPAGEPAPVVERFVAPPPSEAEAWPAVPFPCELNAVVAARRDPSSRDCGVVPDLFLLNLPVPDNGSGDPQAAFAEVAAVQVCMLDALRTATPFHLTLDQRGIDSDVGEGFIGHRVAGQLVVEHLGYDSNPCGGGCPENGSSWSSRCGTVTFGACDDPTRDFCFACDDRTPLHVCDRP